MTDHKHDHDHQHGPDCDHGPANGPAHGAPLPHATSKGQSRRPAAAAASSGYNPMERVYAADGSLDRDYCAKRIPTLVDLLRAHPACFPARIDIDRLGEHLLAPDAQPIRDAADEAAFETALRAFSEHHLHDLVTVELQKSLHEGLVAIAKDEQVSRRDRAAAAVGIALLAVPPDAKGLRGRGIMDLLLRVTMEEQTAQEQMRKKARESENGISNEELNAFWAAHPALRWRHEERYRREVGHVLSEIEKGNVPIAISVDLALRGAATLLGAVAKAKAEGRMLDGKAAEEILRHPFVDDLLDDGPETVASRWRAEIAVIDKDTGAKADERREYRRLLESAVRLVEGRGPATDPILFYAYMKAVVQGHYFVRDAADLEAAKGVFTESGLSAHGTLAYAEYLAGVDSAAKHRIMVAAVEIWPEHEGIRAAATAMGLAEAAAAAAARQGPRYDEPSEDDDVLGESAGEDAGDDASAGGATA